MKKIIYKESIDFQKQSYIFQTSKSPSKNKTKTPNSTWICNPWTPLVTPHIRIDVEWLIGMETNDQRPLLMSDLLACNFGVVGFWVFFYCQRPHLIPSLSHRLASSYKKPNQLYCNQWNDPLRLQRHHTSLLAWLLCVGC